MGGNWEEDWKIIETTEAKVQNRNGNDVTYLGESAIDAAQRADEQLHVAIGERRHVDVALLLRNLGLLVRHIENEDSFECRRVVMIFGCWLMFRRGKTSVIDVSKREEECG